MARRVLAKSHRKLCVGDLSDRVVLQVRTLEEPVFGSPDFGEDFQGKKAWARVRTLSGKTIFDGVSSRDVEVTHEVGIRYDPCVTSETWVRLGDRRLDVVRVEDLEERHEWMLLLCVDRGLVSKEASKA